VIRRKAPEKIFLVAPLHFFGSKSTISRFGERFCRGQYSLVSFLFADLLYCTVPLRAQPFVKVGARAPCSRRHCAWECVYKVSKLFLKVIQI